MNFKNELNKRGVFTIDYRFICYICFIYMLYIFIHKYIHLSQLCLCVIAVSLIEGGTSGFAILILQAKSTKLMHD